jgi:hypothetical protein
MAIHVSEKQLDQIESGRKPGVLVRSERTKKGYAIIPQNVFDQLRPLIQYVVMQVDSSAAEPGNGHAVDWTPERNARRVALINKKHDKRLTPEEKKELTQLMAKAHALRDMTVPVCNEILELILAGLRNRKSKPGTPAVRAAAPSLARCRGWRP